MLTIISVPRGSLGDSSCWVSRLLGVLFSCGFRRFSGKPWLSGAESQPHPTCQPVFVSVTLGGPQEGEALGDHCPLPAQATL
jgi:hypothetical protein